MPEMSPAVDAATYEDETRKALPGMGLVHRRDCRGASLVEYGLTVGLIAVVVLSSLANLGERVERLFIRPTLELSLAIHGGDNLLVNGDFEDVEGLEETEWGYPTDELPGWKSTNGLPFELHHTGWESMAAYQGDHWLDMGASPGNLEIVQDIEDLAPGGAYAVSFWAGDRDNDLSNRMEVWFGAELVGVVDPNIADEMTEYRFLIIGGGGDGSDRLRFVETGPEDSVGISIDQVRVWGAGG